MIKRAIHHITETAKIPSFSSYEERLHPYIRSLFESIPQSNEINIDGNSLIFQIGDDPNQPTIAIAAHLDKINHYGKDYPEQLPVEVTNKYIEGAMDDCAGLGMMLTIAEEEPENWPNLLFFFSEMEESKGLKEHPELLKKTGQGYSHGMGAKRISDRCLALGIIPDEVITLDTTPLFKGNNGIALYARHWELNSLKPTEELITETKKTVDRFLNIDSKIKVDNNTNDYLHYGELFNKNRSEAVVSVALEPAIYPYHQRGERVFTEDIERCLYILSAYLSNFSS